MADMVERVARAMAERAIRAARKWDTPAEKLEEMMQSSVDYCWRDFIDDARAAIKAMREPTDAMLDVGHNRMDFDDSLAPPPPDQ